MIMESVVRVKKSLRAPVRRLSSCVGGLGARKLCARRSSRKRGRRGGGRGGCGRSARTPPPRNADPRHPAVSIRSYQADLDKERKLREAMNAQKNAERAAMRAHFRRKYQLSENPKDANHLRSVGGKVSLPRQLSKLVRPETKTKDDGFNLLHAFQSLSLAKHGKTSTPTPDRGHACKVM